MSTREVKPKAVLPSDLPLEDGDNVVDERKVCGIVMPIAGMGEDYTEAHWGRVRRVFQRAIEKAGMRAQLVWENPEVDVIQTAILQNLYENDVVICDVSNLNPNVMLETGLRLSTKRPTIIVTDRIKRPPFDISTISYIDYQKDLEYNAIEDFIAKLSRKLSEVSKAAAEDRYHSYIEQFRFETVTPTSVTVTSDEYVKERLDELANSVRALMRNQQDIRSRPSVSRNVDRESSAALENPWRHVGYITGRFDEDTARRIEREIDGSGYAICMVQQVSVDEYRYEISASKESNLSSKAVIDRIGALIKRAEDDYLPF